MGAKDFGPEGGAQGGHVGVADGAVEQRTCGEGFLTAPSAFNLQAKMLVREGLDRIAVVQAASLQQVADGAWIFPSAPRRGHLIFMRDRRVELQDVSRGNTW